MRRIQRKGFMGSYETKTFRRGFEEFRNTILLKYASDPKKRICSLGSHNDMLAEQIKFKELHLVDLKFGKCKHRSNKKITYHETSVEYIFDEGFFDNKFDVVIMKDLIEHLDPDIGYIVLKNIHRILVDGGIFIITYPNSRSTNRLLGKQLGMLQQPYDLSDNDKLVGHKKMYCSRMLCSFQKALGMRKIQDIGIMFKPLSNAQMDKYFEKQLDKFIQIGYDLGPNACSRVGGVFRYESTN